MDMGCVYFDETSDKSRGCSLVLSACKCKSFVKCKVFKEYTEDILKEDFNEDE